MTGCYEEGCPYEEEESGEVKYLHQNDEGEWEDEEGNVVEGYTPPEYGGTLEAGSGSEAGNMRQTSSTVTNAQTTWTGAGIYLSRSASGYGGITLCQFAAITSGMSVVEAKKMVQIAKCANAKFR